MENFHQVYSTGNRNETRLYKQASTVGRYKLGDHDYRVSKSDPLMPRYEPIDDKLIRDFFKKPSIKKLIRKTIEYVLKNSEITNY